jgi:hypothetical protein
MKPEGKAASNTCQVAPVIAPLKRKHPKIAGKGR